MYAPRLIDRTLLPLALLLGTAAVPARAQLIEGIEGWADATIGLSTTRWAGPRVPTPVPTDRPRAPARLDSLAHPISVHAGAHVPAARVRAVLEAAEEAHLLLSAAGFLSSFGDAGQGGTGARDVYVVDAPGTFAALDAAGNFSALDGGRAFALVDVRLPSDRLPACVARVLVEAALLELDPAEAAPLRKSSAAYLASLFTGELACDEAERPSRAEASPFGDEGDATRGAELLAGLGAREDGGRGTFLFDMWQFSRQRTWEGRDLRASPDLIEAIAKALSLKHDDFALIAARIADAPLLGTLARGAVPALEAVSFTALPAFTAERPVEPLGSAHLLVRLEAPRPGRRLRVWARSEPGAGFTLAATRLDAHGGALVRIEAEPRPDGRSQLSIELDGDTLAVLVSATNVEDGTPDFDLELTPSLVAFTVDVAP